MEEKFIDGLRVFPKRDSAPEYVLFDLVLNIDNLNRFIDDNRELLKNRELRMQLQMSKQGKPWLKINTFVPDASKVSKQIATSEIPTSEIPTSIPTPDDLPF